MLWQKVTMINDCEYVLSTNISVSTSVSFNHYVFSTCCTISSHQWEERSGHRYNVSRNIFCSHQWLLQHILPSSQHSDTFSFHFYFFIGHRALSSVSNQEIVSFTNTNKLYLLVITYCVVALEKTEVFKIFPFADACIVAPPVSCYQEFLFILCGYR